jgi:predicted unusual protein kinase regulating ubiquinone biosynthesis (AarF/ABC1/UbiB family)
VSDLNQVTRVARVSAGWIPGLDLGPVLDELKRRVSEELDYSLEAQAQHQFAEAFAGDPDFALPDVVTGSDHVIVSEWLAGTPLSRVIASGTQDERDAAASKYLEFLLAGPQRAGLLHADPHPGNFRMTADGRLGVLDFGAVNRLPDGLPPHLGTLLAKGLDGDGEAVVEGLREDGFIKSSIDVDAAALMAYLEPFLVPARSDTFRFTRGFLRDLFAHINDPRRPQWSIGLKLNLPPQYLLIHRVWLGGIGVLCQIEGEVATRDILSRNLPGFAPQPL